MRATGGKAERGLALGLVVGSLVFSAVVLWAVPGIVLDDVAAAFVVGGVILGLRAVGHAIGRRVFRARSSD